MKRAKKSNGEKIIFAVLGDAKTRKSSLVRCLTGVSSMQREIQVTLMAGEKSIFVRSQSIQEYRENGRFLMPIDLYNIMVNGKFNIGLITLRIKAVGRTPRRPEGIKYLEYFFKKGWKLKIIELHNGNPQIIANKIFIQFGQIRITNRTNNDIATEVRKIWNFH